MANPSGNNSFNCLLCLNTQSSATNKSDYHNRVRVMVFNATFNNISVISWRSVLLVKQTGVPGENHRPIWSRIKLTKRWRALIG
jgi:hypothetical protein